MPRKRAWNRFPPPSFEEAEPLSKDGEQLEKRAAFNRASKLPPVVPFTLYCPVCSLPVGRDEVVVGQGDGSVAGFWDAICPTCALRP